MWRAHSRSGAGGGGGSAVRTQRAGTAGEEDLPAPKKSCVVHRGTKSLLISPPGRERQRQMGRAQPFLLLRLAPSIHT